MADEGVHEIQLNGKQLVFLFMSATVVAVVIFLSGVMVGRGVRPAPVEAAAASAPAAPVDPTTTSMPTPSSRTTTAVRPPVSTQEELTYAERLEAPVPPPETLREPEAPNAQSAPPVERAALAEPAGAGYVVQVGAYPRATADAIARGLAAKGFPSFVLPRDKGLFAVRVGKYSERREAEAVARRLETDEQFKSPWVTR